MRGDTHVDSSAEPSIIAMDSETMAIPSVSNTGLHTQAAFLAPWGTHLLMLRWPSAHGGGALLLSGGVSSCLGPSLLTTHWKVFTVMSDICQIPKNDGLCQLNEMAMKEHGPFCKEMEEVFCFVSEKGEVFSNCLSCPRLRALVNQVWGHII